MNLKLWKLECFYEDNALLKKTENYSKKNKRKKKKTANLNSFKPNVEEAQRKV